MKDYLKRPLEVGDNVVYVEKGYRNFQTGVILRFTPKFVIIQQPDGYELKQTSDQLIKIIENYDIHN